MANQNRPVLKQELQAFQPVAIIGGGTIGLSWTALFLAHGLEVRINDPRPDIKEIAEKEIKQLIPVLKELGLPVDGLTDKLIIEKDLKKALDGAKVIQENGPERLEFKQKLFAEMEALTDEDVLFLSSSSGIKASDISKNMKHPGRMLIGHPFNPPHLVPLVELVPGDQTEQAAIERAKAFYLALGKQPLVLKKEIGGFVANRLQSALFRESIHLVLEGVVTMEELDDIVTSSIGLRWAAAGPFLTFHLGGGKQGLPGFLKHLGPGMDKRWTDLGEPRLDDATVDQLSNASVEAFGKEPIEQLEQARDKRQLAILNSRKEQE